MSQIQSVERRGLLRAGLALALALLSRSVPSSGAARPWWEDPVARHAPVPVPDDHSWRRRRTGVTRKWSNGLAVWSHYDAKSLARASGRGGCPRPWTAGLMVKSLRKLNANAFELFSVYTRESRGDWAKGFMEERAADGNLQHGHVFEKTRNRVISLPGTNLPDCDEDTVQMAGTSQATIVEPDRATFSGPRWLPGKGRAEAFLKASKGKNDDGKFQRWQFCEAWLAEPVDGRAEGRKVGMFCLYDGLSGELTMMIRMNEVLLPGSMDPQDEIDVAELEASLGGSPAWKSASRLLSSRGGAFEGGTGPPPSSIDDVLRSGGYRRMEGRAVTTADVVTGRSTTTKYRSDGDSPVDGCYFPEDDGGRYLRCRFEDGVYVRIPRKLSPGMERVCLEIGCFELDGRSFHRLLAVGDRTRGAIHTTVYERYC